MPEYAAFGTVLNMGDGSGGFDAIAQVTNIGGPALALDTTDVTCHDSTGGWEEVVGTILRTGEVSLDLAYDPADGTHDVTTGLAKKMKDKTLEHFQLIFPDTATTEWDFDAFVTGFDPSAPHDGALTAAVTLKISGAPTLA